MVLILRSPVLGNNARRLGGARRHGAADVGAAAVPLGASPDEAMADTVAPACPEPVLQTLAIPDEYDMAEARALREQAAAEAVATATALGYKEGYEAGQAAGDTEGRAAYVAALTQIEALAQNLGRELETNLVRAEDSMLAMVYSIACKILGESLSTSEGIQALVTQALTHVKIKEDLVIRVHPHDLELIGEGAAFDIASTAQWRADSELQAGGCLVESVHGTLDARLDTQLGQLKRTLLAERARGAVPSTEDTP